MSDGIENAGALVTAATAASVLDGAQAHGGESVGAHPAVCLNCGAAMLGPYCAQCGQRGHLHRSLGAAAHELLHGVLHFDSKLWNTLPLLIARPGVLTRNYVMGQRARYISPVALFLLSFFLMFLVFGSMGTPKISLPEGKSRVEIVAELDQSIRELETDLAAARLDPKRAGEVARLLAMRDTMMRTREGAEKGEAPDVLESIGAAVTASDLSVDTGDKTRDDKLRTILRNPEFLLYKMKQKGYKLGFLLVPLTLPWLWLLFVGKRDVRGYDHFVYLLYSLSFVSLLAIVISLLYSTGLLPIGAVFWAFVLIPPIHMLFQMRQAYALGWGGAVWRTAILVFAAFLTLVLYISGIAFLGLLD